MAEFVEVVFLLDIGLGRIGVEQLAVAVLLVVGDGREREIHVLVLLGIVLDLEVFAPQSEIHRAPFEQLGDGLDVVARIERQRRHDGKARTPRGAEFAPEETALERVDMLDLDAAIEPGRQEQRVAGIGLLRRGAFHDRDDVVVGVIVLPGLVIGLLPFRLAHLGMRRGQVIEIVFVEIGIHRHPGFGQLLVILRSRQRRQEEELEQIDRQLALDHLDVVHHRFKRVVREADDIAGIGDDPRRLPRQQHLAVFRDLVLPLLGAHQVRRIDILQTDEDALDAGAGALFHEVRQLVAQRIDLDDDADRHLLLFAQVDQAVEDRLPVLVAREIVVGDEEAAGALRDIGAHDLLDIVGRAPPRLAPLHVDDGAERTLIGAAAPGVEAGDAAGGAYHLVGGQEWNRRAFDRRQIVHEIVERLEVVRESVAQHHFHAPLGLAGEQRAAHGACLVQMCVLAAQHAEHARDVKAADGDLDAARAQRPRDVQRPGELVGLHADQHHHPGAGLFDHLGDALGPDQRVGFVMGVNFELDIVAQHVALGAVHGQAMQRRKRV